MLARSGFEAGVWDAHVRNASADTGPGGDFSRLVTQSYRAGIDALETQARTTQVWATEVFSRFDVVLCPAVPAAAPLLSEVPEEERGFPLDDALVPSEQVYRWSRQANVPKLPSTVVPLGAGAVSGLPIGAQLLAPYLEDYTSLQFAVDAQEAGIIEYVAPPAWRGLR